ncbi:MAG: TrmH family RNA methyltransferase [Candidatus Eisenbacteria bacterium]|nr:TrmH family RNA methyltransferase [Candidatus Eisenbacteria bacterium]
MPRFDPKRQEDFLQSLNPRRAELKRSLDARRLPYAVAVDNPDKQMNIGNLIRTAHSFLCGELVLIGSASYQASGSNGVERYERIRHFPDRDAFLAWLPSSGYTSIAVETTPEAERLDRFEFPERPLFVVGNELHGLDERLLAACERRVMIPQFGLVPCLNVNISCSIVLYEYVTRRHPEIEMATVRGRKFLVDERSGRKPRAD